MARDTQGSPANEKKLEQYGVWVKVKPREVVPVAVAEDTVELSDLETPRAGLAAGSPAPGLSALTAEEEKLLDELETELGPGKEKNDVLVPDEEPLLDDEGELPDIENMTDESGDGGLAEEELPELEEEPLPAPRAAAHRKPASSPGASEVEVTLTENGGGKERFDDLEALESELASVTSSTRGASSSSADILSRIEDELRSIRTDLTQLRGELTGLRKSAGPQAASTPATGAETQSGFFDEDEDETIALTGDELDNILNTADIMEETAEAPSAGEAEGEIAPPLDDILSFDTPELDDDKAAPAEGIDDGLVLSGDSLLPGGEESLEELPAEMVLDDLDELSPAKAKGAADELDDLSELDLEGIPEIEMEEQALAGRKPPKPAAHTDTSDETIDLETLDLGEEPTVVQAASAQVDGMDDLADDVDLEALAAEAEELAGNAPPTETEDLEIGELESIGDEPFAGNGEKEIEIDFESDKEPAAAMEDLEPADLEAAEEILEAEEIGEELPAARGGNAPGGTSDVPDDLKDEIRTVLKYMDHLLEALPDEKIQEFASSDYFVMYKKLFEDLGLGE